MRIWVAVDGGRARRGVVAARSAVGSGGTRKLVAVAVLRCERQNAIGVKWAECDHAVCSNCIAEECNSRHPALHIEHAKLTSVGVKDPDPARLILGEEDEAWR